MIKESKRKQIRMKKKRGRRGKIILNTAAAGRECGADGTHAKKKKNCRERRETVKAALRGVHHNRREWIGGEKKQIVEF